MSTDQPRIAANETTTSSPTDLGPPVASSPTPITSSFLAPTAVPRDPGVPTGSDQGVPTPTNHAAPTTIDHASPPSSSPSTSPHTPVAPQPYPQPVAPSSSPSVHPSSSSSTYHPSPTPSSPAAAGSSSKLLSTHLLAHPNHSAGKAMRVLFPRQNPLVRLARRFRVKHSVITGLTAEEEAHWEAQGKELRRKAGWRLTGEAGEGVEITELFWKMYISLLPTLERDPLSGLVPPDLLGSTTTMPLTIISLIPDIMQHYHDVIIRAKKEVFLATNYWQPSNSVNTISGALRKLSDLVVKEKRPKVVVKIMYDRGSWEQLWNAHAPVKEKEWGPLKLPEPHEIEGLHMEVVNFHRVLLGTFHAKFLIVDRKVALINSNNIQDRPNLELMSHLEGPIVDSFYEIALHSWYNRLSPPLPCMSTPYQPPMDPSGKRPQYLFQDHNPYLDDIEILKAARAARLLLRRQTHDLDMENQHGRERFRDAVKKVVDQHRGAFAEWKPGEELEKRAELAIRELRDFRDKWSGVIGGSSLGGGSRGPSRSGSRGPSRRGSAADIKLLPTGDHDTRANTVHNAAHLDNPSEAPSSPTIVPSTPLASPPPTKSRTAPPAPLDFTGENGHEKPHVAFAPLDTAGLDGSGRFLDGDFGSDMEKPSAKLIVPSPASASAANSPISPILKVPGDDRGRSSARGHARILEDEDRVVADSPAASSIRLPRNSVEEPNVQRDGAGTPLPATALMPDELEKRGSAMMTGDDELSRMSEKPGASRRSSEIPPEGTGSKRMFKLSKMFNAAGVLSEAWATVEDSDDLDTFRPHVVHAPHDPLPIAMCCRKPHGFPGHHDIRNPQNAAWLAGFRYAKKKVFIQTPTLNARPIVRAIKQTCRRGVEVVLLLDLGFNDKGESIPFQGGTNEEVVDRLYKVLRAEKKEQHLTVYWYTGKDQVRPLNAVKKQRNCHIKFAAYDDEVLIIGNGNQDSQSWFHSQEVNVMVDSKQIVREMMDTLLVNQNTTRYGRVDSDGVWRDKEGKTLEDYGATAKGAFRGLSGFIAFAKTI